MAANMSVNVAGVAFANPIIAASGTFGFGEEYAKYFDLASLGGISVKGLTRAPRDGNDSPRIAETPDGMLNSVGLQNPGIDAFLSEHLPWLAKRGTKIIANVAGASVEDYVYMCERLRGAPVDMIEVNVSCPNVKKGAMAFGATPEGVAEVTRACRAVAEQPIIIKLTPNVTDIASCAAAAEDAGADAVSLINTLLGMAIDPVRRRPVLANVTGGLSGPAVKPVALRMVWQTAKAVKIPVIGMGGIMTGSDAAEFMLAGASAVMVGTAGIMDPLAWPRIAQELCGFAESQGVSDIAELVGALCA